MKVKLTKIIYMLDTCRKKSNSWFTIYRKVEPLEFLYRLKSVALEFNRLTNREREILKHWIRNTVDETISENVVKILDADKEEAMMMVANNAFMIKEMKEKVEKEARKQDKIEIAKKLLTKKFGNLNNEYNQKIDNLNISKLDLIIENILEVESIEEIEKYL